MSQEAQTLQQAMEQTFTTFDGTELFYRRWPARATPARGAILMLHRGHEHSGRMAHIPGELGLPDFSFFAWDARGNGRSPGPRGDSPGMDASVLDLDAFVRHVSESHAIPLQDIIVLAQGMGAVLAAAWAHDYAPRIRGLILGSPTFKARLCLPFARQAIALRQRLRGNFFLKSPFGAKCLTHDPGRIAAYNSDPLIARPISARLLTGLLDTAERIVADAAAITLPVQLFISGADWVARQWPQHVFYNRLTCPLNERRILPGFFHDLFGEKDREKVYVPVRAFIERLFATPAQFPDLSRADRQSPSATKQKWIESPYPLLSARGLYFALARTLLRFPGSLSAGVRLGLEKGFDSDEALEYVYRNTPAGRTALGRYLDALYLNRPGRAGVRVRKEQVRETVQEAARQLRGKDLPVRVLDLAAGTGRSVLDALQGLEGEWESAVLHDITPANKEAGQRLIEERGLADKVRFESGDAFDPEALAGLDPRPTLAVVSGLYELFTDNTLPQTSLRSLAAVVPSGGFLIYTNQPWHPCQECRARVLGSRRQDAPRVTRYRSQEEMDQLVAGAGFTKIRQRIDPQGIFTVSLAVRNQE